MIFLHLCDPSETAPGRMTRFFRCQPSGDAIALGQLQVSENLVFQFPIQIPFPDERQQTRCRGPKLHDSASRNRATRAVALSQFATSTVSCFEPALVSE